MNPTAILTTMLLAAGTVPAVAAISFDGSPGSTASGWIVLESAFGKRIEPTDGMGGEIMTGQAGYLHRTGERTAWGGTVRVQMDHVGFRYGGLVRYRHWLGESFGLDAGAGLMAYGRGYENLGFHPAPALELGVTYKDWVGVHAGIDMLRSDRFGSDVEPQVMLRFGKFAGPAIAIGMASVSSLDLKRSRGRR